jgi:hypothetical protein
MAIGRRTKVVRTNDPDDKPNGREVDNITFMQHWQALPLGISALGQKVLSRFLIDMAHQPFGEGLDFRIGPLLAPMYLAMGHDADAAWPEEQDEIAAADG